MKSRKAVSDDRYADLHLDQQLCFALYAASNLMTRLYRPLLDELDITYPQYLVMLALWQFAPLTVSQLCERLHLDTGTITPLLKRLESAEMVRRRRSKGDERQVIISLTAKGAALKRQALAIPHAVFCEMCMPAEPLLELRSGVQSLVAALSAARLKSSAKARARKG